VVIGRTAVRRGTTVLIGKLGLILLLSQGAAVKASEIKVIASPGVAGVVTELSRQFEAATGHKVLADFAVVAVSKRKIDAGALFDIAILSPEAIDDLVRQGKIAADTRAGFGRTGLGVAVRKDSARPDIGTVDAFKRTMLTAKSVGHSKEGLSGVHFMAALDRLGITAAMKPRLRTYDSGEITRGLVTGEVEVAVTGIGPILSAPELAFVGALPPELQSHVVFTAGISPNAKDSEATRALLRFMTAPAATPVFKAKGMERD